jgi:hypothetical protein
VIRQFYKFSKTRTRLPYAPSQAYNVKNIIHEDGRDKCGFCKNMVETHVRPICVLLLLNYISREAELILVPQTHT